MSEHDRIVELIPIYALGAATEPEADEVVRHLQHCPVCEQELATHLSTVADLEGPGTPPADLWDRIERRISKSSRSNVVVLSERRSRKAITYLISVAAAAALVFSGAVLSTLMRGDVVGDGAVLAAAEAAAAEEGARSADFEVDGLVVAQIVLTQEGEGFVIPTEELAALDESRAYQLWVINTDDAVISAGVLGSSPGPSVFTWTGDIAGLALTREIAGGVVSSEGDVVSVVTDI